MRTRASVVSSTVLPRRMNAKKDATRTHSVLKSVTLSWLDVLMIVRVRWSVQMDAPIARVSSANVSPVTKCLVLPNVRNGTLVWISRVNNSLIKKNLLSVRLKQYFMEIYNQCTIACPPSDLNCRGTCARDYDENTNACPCQSNCPNGCPCPNYQCPADTTTTTSLTTTTPAVSRKSVLILNTRNSNNAVITDGNGKEEYPADDFFFMFGNNTEVYRSCSVTWHGELFIFGGVNDQKQISKLNGCKLERVGNLSFEHYQGACATVNDREIYLCFDWNSTTKCRKANEPMGIFEEIKPSDYDHKRTRIGASSG